MAKIKGYWDIVEECIALLENGDVPSNIRVNKTMLESLATRLNMCGTIYTLYGMTVIVDNTVTGENFIIEVE